MRLTTPDELSPSEKIDFIIATGASARSPLLGLLNRDDEFLRTILVVVGNYVY